MNETPLLDQIRVYSEALVEDLPEGGSGHPEPLPRPPVRRGLLVAVVMAAVVLVAGVVPLLVMSGGSDPADDRGTTSSTQQSTSTTQVTETTVPTQTTVTTQATVTTLMPEEPATVQSFAPFLSGFGVGEYVQELILESQSVDTSQLTFMLWTAWANIDWYSIAGAVADEPTRGRLLTFDPTGGTKWMEWTPESGLLTLGFFDSTEIVELDLSIAGTSHDWLLEISDPLTGLPVGSIVGSLPTKELDEILAWVAGPGPPMKWIFVTDGEVLEPVTPPWAPFLETGERTDLVAANETVVAFVVVDGRGPGGNQHLWVSADGHVWEDLGPAPWAGDVYGVERIEVRDGDLLVLVSGVEDFDAESEQPGEAMAWRAYRSGDSGATWTEITQGEFAASVQP